MQRNNDIDTAKGFAIILVVLGHVIQVNNPQYDESLAFRFIYAFHMPLFVFLAGASFSFWHYKFSLHSSFPNSLVLIFKKLKSSFLRLIIPFIFWTLFSARSVDLTTCLLKLQSAFEQPDTSLWFLLCIFYCTLTACAYYSIIHIIALLLKKVKVSFDQNQFTLDFLFIGFLIFLIIRNKIEIPITNEPIPNAMFMLVKDYMIYFFLGLYCFLYNGFNFPRFFGAIVILLFLLFAQFWNRVEFDNLSPYAPSVMIGLGSNYTVITALLGSFALIYFSKFFNSNVNKRIKEATSFIGLNSLGIYAIHGYFLHVEPWFFAPLVISLTAVNVIRSIPVLRNLTLGID